MPTREWPIPNIVIFYADDMDSDAVLNSIVKTPHLDTLKEEGMTFPSNCVIFSQCWVSRATLVTGMYASVHQHLKVGSDAMFNGVVPWNETLFPQLKSSGYHVVRYVFYVLFFYFVYCILRSVLFIFCFVMIHHHYCCRWYCSFFHPLTNVSFVYLYSLHSKPQTQNYLPGICRQMVSLKSFVSVDSLFMKLFVCLSLPQLTSSSSTTPQKACKYG